MRTGDKMTEETKAKISKALKGKQPKNVIGGWNKGKKFSDELRKKLSLAHIGQRAWNKGLHVRLNPKGEFKKGDVGEKCHAWKGGLSSEIEKIRGSLELKLWRKSVYERDNFTCQKTGKRGGDLVAHHIQNFSEFAELRFAIDNGITLSKQAHNEFHKKYGKRNNTKEQLVEFLTNK